MPKKGLSSSVDWINPSPLYGLVQTFSEENIMRPSIPYHDGPEALLLGNVHVVLHVTEDGRLHVQSRPVRSLAAQEESGAFLQSGLTVLHQLVQVSHVVLRAVLD